jgi:site-specific DNA-cytosine methylase
MHSAAQISQHLGRRVAGNARLVVLRCGSSKAAATTERQCARTVCASNQVVHLQRQRVERCCTFASGHSSDGRVLPARLMQKRLFTTLCSVPSSRVVVDIFCGAGGFSAGIHMGKGEVALAIDNDPVMLAMHQNNFPNAKHVLVTLGGAPEKFAHELLQFVHGRPWHLHGSPPCQSFSIANRAKGHQVGGDARSDLSYWFLTVVYVLSRSGNPPASWSMEQVPTALRLLQKNHPWLNNHSSVSIYKVFGWQFGAPTLRKRLFIGAGWSLRPLKEVDTLNVCDILDLEREFKLAPNQIAIRGAKNNFYRDVKKGETKNTRVDSTKGEGLRPIDRVCYAIMASQRLSIWTRDGSVAGSWRRRRLLHADEAKLIQGFPSSYTIASPQVTLNAFSSIQGLDSFPATTYRVGVTHQTKAIGNSVVPLISKNLWENLVGL